MHGEVRCIVLTCSRHKQWDRLVPLPKERRLAELWIRACWPYGIVLDEELKFLICIDHFSIEDSIRMKKEPHSDFVPCRFECCNKHNWTLECNSQFVDLLMDINNDVSDEILSRTGSLIMVSENDELSETQKRCSHYLEDPAVGLANLDNISIVGGQDFSFSTIKSEPWSDPLPPLQGGLYGAENINQAVRNRQTIRDRTAFLHFDCTALNRPICEHGYFKDSCLRCCGQRIRQPVKSSRPIPGPKASIPFLESAFQEKIHNPYEGSNAIPALRPGIIRTREEGLETQLEASYRGILKKYYSNKWSSKTQCLTVAHRFNVSKIKCCICDFGITDNISLAGHLCGHLEDVVSWTEEQIHDRLIDPNLTVLMSPDPYAAAINRTCAYCPSQPTFETPFEYILHLDKTHIHDMKQYRCRICEQNHRSLLELACHLNLCHCGMELPYSCDVCGYRTSFHADMLFHFTVFHRGEDLFYCPFCLEAVELKPTYAGSNRKGSIETDAAQDTILYLDCENALRHLMVHFNQENGQFVSKYKFCRKCVLHMKTSKDHMKKDHLNIVAGAKASYMSSTDEEGGNYGVEDQEGMYSAMGPGRTVTSQRKPLSSQRRKPVQRVKTLRLNNKQSTEPIENEVLLRTHQIKTEPGSPPTSHRHLASMTIAEHSVLYNSKSNDETHRDLGEDDKDPSFSLPRSRKRLPSPPRRSSLRIRRGRRRTYAADSSDSD